MKTLSTLIKEKKFDWINVNIEKNFTATEVAKDTEYKLFNFDRYISSEDAIAEMKKDGWEPANISQLLSWKDWKDEWVVALGSVAKVGGNRDVPYLGRNDSERGLYLHWFGDDWDAIYRFLAVRTLSLEPQKSDTLNLGLLARVEKIEKILAHYNLNALGE